jgi:hypothetical protein
MPVVRAALDEDLLVEDHFVIMVLAKEIEVRECEFRESNGDITESLMEEVFVFEAQLFGLHAEGLVNRFVKSHQAAILSSAFE